jgi:predicted ferric reductase
VLWGVSGGPGSLLLLAAGGGTALDHAVWLGARSAGLVAYGLATCSVLVGVTAFAWSRDRNPSRAIAYDLHRSLALLTLLVVGAHVLLLALDRFVRFGAKDLLVPFASWYRPAWTGFGVLAAYLLLAVYLSFYVRSRIGYKTWRTLHYASFAIFVMGTVHGLRAGSDSAAIWARWLYTVAILAVAVAVAYRLVWVASPQPARAREPRAGDLKRVRLAAADSRGQGAASSASSLRAGGIQRVPAGGLEDGLGANEEAAPP